MNETRVFQAPSGFRSTTTSGKRHLLKTFAVSALAIFCSLSGPVQAQDAAASFPNKSIRIVVPFAAGGASDVLARIIGKKLTDAWGQSVVVENKPGGNAQIGAAMVARAEPDGYTLLVVDLSALTQAPSLMPNLTYSPEKDLTPVSILAYSPHILVVANKLPVKTFDEFIAYAKAQKTPINYGAPLGAAPHLSGVLLSQKEGIKLNFIGYKGGAQVMTDLAGGQIDATMNSYLATYPMVRSGNFKIIAVASPARFGPIPDVPAIAERIPGYVTGSFQGMMAPAATPAAIIEKLNAEIKKIISQPDMQKQFADLGSEADNKSPAELKKWMAEQTVYWAQVIRDGNIKLD